ncbi:hypothetical protein O1611_g2051 [Lasiodiplodia mahajangana]|uniref:Uncharacterized protein n=1 Tax=Lasiodiplodia mahajangana TaxID=1108764 RepID=A0ACC2JVU0_9PEZI|nr:hypothetical protein O1611_g2051 [Lasiodiplodia mahajangana]
MPFRGAGWGNPSWWGGYCNHGNVLFPTWHRAYLVRIENALRAVTGYADITLPFWDETGMSARTAGIPSIFLRRSVIIPHSVTGDGEKTIDNPLRSYKFQDGIWDNLNPIPDADYSKPKGYETTRYPFSGLASSDDTGAAQQHNKFVAMLDTDKLLNDNVINWLGNSIVNSDGRVYNEDIYYSTPGNDLSPQTVPPKKPRLPVVSLESPHNDMHLAIGGFDIPGQGNFDSIIGANGDMGENDTAAFDPIFFFHHCFIDKVFWDWQKKWGSRTQLTIEAGYPGTNSVDYQGPTPGVSGNTWLSMESPLAPFTIDDTEGGKTLTSNDVVDIVKQLRYKYYDDDETDSGGGGGGGSDDDGSDSGGSDDSGSGGCGSVGGGGCSGACCRRCLCKCGFGTCVCGCYACRSCLSYEIPRLLALPLPGQEQDGNFPHLPSNPPTGDQVSPSVQVVRVSGVNRAKLAGSFVLVVRAIVNGEDSIVGTESVLSRWKISGCANGQQHLGVKAFVPLVGLDSKALSTVRVGLHAREVMIMKIPSPPSWEARAAAKRAETLNNIPAEWRLSPADLAGAEKERHLTGPFIQRFLDADEVSIIAKDSVQLVDDIRRAKLTAVQVTRAFCKTAAIAHQISNCLHEVFFDQALERAAWLDVQFAKKQSTVGPLHGLPISLKDQFHVKGVDTTMGYIGWIGSNLGISDPKQAHNVESQIVTELLSLGAVLYCKTSLPQTLLLGETKNNLIGETLNPNNRNLSCGGSSGGEGALQALRGSTLGLGTDIGGSVRIPAGFNGTYSLKPTPERLSYRCAANNNPGENTYRSTVGIMSTSLEGLGLLLQADLSTKPWLRDPAVIPMPFRDEIAREYGSRANPDGTANDAIPLKLGVLWTDGAVQPHPPVTRGLNTVVEAMRSAGHQIVDWNPPSQIAGRDIHLAFLMADGARDIHNQLNLSGEPLIPELQETFQLREPMNLIKYQDLTLQGLQYESQYSDYWNSTAEKDGSLLVLSHLENASANSDIGQIVDAVIMPVAPHAAVIPGKYYHTAYTEIINLLNYSVVVIPVTKADKQIDKVDTSYQPSSDLDRMNWEAYDPEVYDGGPVGLQIVGRKFEEEKVLSIAKTVISAMRTGKAKAATTGADGGIIRDA